MAAWAVIENQNKILLIRRSVKTSRSGQWCFPGGGIKASETPDAACLREVKEETGLDIKVVDLVMTINRHVYFRCHQLMQAQEITLKLNECDEFAWIEPCKLLEVGIVMELRNVYQVLSTMGYEIELTDGASEICGQCR